MVKTALVHDSKKNEGAALLSFDLTEDYEEDWRRPKRHVRFKAYNRRSRLKAKRHR